MPRHHHQKRKRSLSKEHNHSNDTTSVVAAASDSNDNNNNDHYQFQLLPHLIRLVDQSSHKKSQKQRHEQNNSNKKSKNANGEEEEQYSQPQQQQHGEKERKQQQEALHQSVQVLTQHLQQGLVHDNENDKDDDEKTRRRVFDQEVAQVLLSSWVIPQLLRLEKTANNTTTRRGDVEFSFHVWNVAWQVLWNTDNNHNKSSSNTASWNISSVLNQSTLMKVMPLMVQSMTNESRVQNEDNDKPAKDPTQQQNKEDPIVQVFVRVLSTPRVFGPTLDVVLDNLLLPLVHVQGPALTATLQWIQTFLQMRRGNPKTSFQLLVRSSTLAALSQCYGDSDEKDNRSSDLAKQQELVRNILSLGLVSAQHHLEGMLPLLLKASQNKPQSPKKGSSPAKSTKFHCYQEELLSLLRDQTTTSAQSRDLIAIVPLLMKEFLTQLKEMDHVATSHGKTHKKKAPREMQSAFLSVSSCRAAFALYVIMVTPLLTNMSSKSDDEVPRDEATVWRSLFHLTHLLVEHNIYVPSQDDSEQSQTKFLQRVTNQILSIVDNAPQQKYHDPIAIQGRIGSLESLLELNHHLLHPQLDRSVLLICHLLKETRETSRDALDAMEIDTTEDEEKIISSNTNLPFSTAQGFLVRLVTTYQRLRQQSYLVQALLKALSNTNDITPKVLGTLLQGSIVTSALARAVDTSPISEIQNMFSCFQEWLSMHCQINNEETKCSPHSLSVAVDLAVVVFRTIQIQQSSAQKISDLVHDFAETIVQPLLNRNNGDDEWEHVKTEVVLKLCAWLIHLQGRCAFWLGREHQLQLPRGIEIAIQKAKIKYEAIGDDSSLEDQAVLLLMSHRLQQIVSLVHDEQLAMLHSTNDAMLQERDGDNDKILSLECEGKHLAALLTLAATKMSKNRRHCGWIYIAQCAHVWAIYATDDAIDRFLKWLLQPGSMSSESNLYDDEAQQVARTLLADVTFFDVKRIGSRIHMAALDFSCQWIIQMARPQGKELYKLLNSNPTQQQSLFQALNPDWSKYKIIWETKRSTSEIASIISAMRFVNSLPPSLLVASDVTIFTRRALLVEHAVVSLFCEETFDVGSILGWVGALRYAIATSMMSISQTRTKEQPGNDESFEDFLTYIDQVISSTRMLLQSRNEETTGPNSNTQTFLSSTSLLLSSLLDQAIERSVLSKEEKHGDHFSALTKFLKQTFKVLEKSKSWIVSRMVIRCLLYGADGVYTSGQLEDVALLRELLSLAGSNAIRTCASNSLENDQGYSVLGDCLRMIEKWKIRDDSSTVIEKMIRDNVNSSSLLSLPTKGAPSRKSALYNLACLTKASPSDSQVEVVLNELSSRNDESDQLLEAALCSLVQHLDEKQCHETICMLLSTGSVGPSILSRLRLAKNFLSAETNDRVIAIMSEKGSDILRLATHSLNPCMDDKFDLWDRHVVESQDLLRALIRRKDVLSLRDQDLGIILSGLNAVIGGSLTETGNTVSLSIFVSSSQTMLLLLQRFGKQLHACVPLVVSVLYSLLQSCMCLGLGDSEVATRSNEFCRLCETLVAHRDIYKKHVVGLILEFVEKLGNDVSLVVKNCLLPSIHCLLDMLTIHETNQLNALMHDNSKATFRSIYQTYRKLYAYKGQ